MAREKKSMIGFDPLAWLDNDKPESAKGSATKSQPSSGNAQKKNKAKKTADKKNSHSISLLGKNIDESALLKGNELLEKIDNSVFEKTISEIFSKHADIESIFESKDEIALSIVINNVIQFVIDNRYDAACVNERLLNIVISCQAQGVLAQHFPIATEMFLKIAKELIGRSWTKAVSATWSELLDGLAKTICAAYKDEVVEVENIEMETAVMSDDIEPQESDHEEDLIGAGHPVLQLNCVQDISKSQALKNDMLTLINDNDEIDIDASEVERIDGSALQLLCALFNYAAQNNLVINWLEPTDALKQAVSILGMQNILELS